MLRVMVEGSKEYNGQSIGEHQMSVILEAMERAGILPPPMPGVYDNVPTVSPTDNHEYSWKREWETGTSYFDVKDEMTFEEMEAFAEKCKEGKKGLLIVKSDVDPEDIKAMKAAWDKQVESLRMTV